MNPDRDIFIVHLSPFGVSTNRSLWPQTYRTLMNYSNIHFVNARLDELTDNPNLRNFLAKEDILRGQFIEPVSDLARLLLMYRFGGTYMDSDIIVLKDISDLGSNWFCTELKGVIGNSVFNINNFGTGKMVTHQSIQ